MQRQEHPELAPQIGERIRRIRKKEGLSLEGLALRCDMNPAYVGHIERGMRNPTLATLERICKGLGIRVEDLFKGLDVPVDMESAPNSLAFVHTLRTVRKGKSTYIRPYKMLCHSNHPSWSQIWSPSR